MRAVPVEPVPFGEQVERLIREAQEGNREARGQLLVAYRQLLLAQANDRLPGPLKTKEGASDVVQNTFMEAIRDFDQFRGTTEAELRHWLCAILENNIRIVVRKYLDTQKTDIGRETPQEAIEGGSHLLKEQAAATPSPSSIASQKEEEERLRRALERLTPEEREIIDLRHRQELTYPEIGDRLGITKEAARKRFVRAIKQLEGHLDALRTAKRPPPA